MTDGCSPVTSVVSTMPAISPWSAGERRCTSEAATTSIPPRWKRCSASTPRVAKVAVVGVADPVLGQIGVAFVVPSADGPPTLDELRQWVRERLADYKAPDRLNLVDDLPLTAMSKIDKRALAATLPAPGGS